MDADRKLPLDELQQVDGVDARHGQRVEEEGDGRAGRGRRPAGQEDEACEYGWAGNSGLCTYKVTSQFIDSDSMYGTPLTIDHPFCETVQNCDVAGIACSAAYTMRSVP